MDRKRLGRLATGLLLVAMVFFVGRTCSAEHAEITLILSSADELPVDALTVRIVRDGDVVAQFETSDIASGQERKWTLDLDPGSYVLELDVDRGGSTQRSNRRLEAVPRATIRVDLSERSAEE